MRIGDYVWHSSRKKIPNAKIPQYENPSKILTQCNYFTVMPVASRGLLEVMKYGEDIDNTWTVIANARAFGGKIKEGDLMWVDGHSPDQTIEEKYGNGSSANAVVRKVSSVNYTLSIILTKNKEQVFS